MSNLQLALPGVLPGDAGVEWVWREDSEDMSDVKRFEHTTVMRDEVVRALAPRSGGTYVDATLGGGGHTVAILEAEPKARIVALDRDPVAIAAAEERLGRLSQFDPAVKKLRRIYVSGAVECEMDDVGRILVPPTLREHAHLAKDVLWAGAGRYAELWDKEHWQREFDTNDEEKRAIAARLAELGL